MKLFKLCLVMVVFVWGIAANFPAEAASQNGIPILLYHHVSGENTDMPKLTVTGEAFAAQMKRLHEAGFRTIPTDQLLAYMSGEKITLPEKPLVISFDDGYADNYRTAFPILRKYNFQAIIFMVGVNIDAPERLSRSQMREMSAYGIEFGAHSVTHSDLTTLPPDKLRREIRQSKADIEKVIGQDVRLFSYPYGFYNLPVLEAVNFAGFDGAMTVLSGLAKEDYDNIFLMRRVPIFSDTDFDKLFEKLDANQPKEGLMAY